MVSQVNEYNLWNLNHIPTESNSTTLCREKRRKRKERGEKNQPKKERKTYLGSTVHFVDKKGTITDDFKPKTPSRVPFKMDDSWMLAYVILCHLHSSLADPRISPRLHSWSTALTNCGHFASAANRTDMFTNQEQPTTRALCTFGGPENFSRATVTRTSRLEIFRPEILIHWWIKMVSN